MHKCFHSLFFSTIVLTGLLQPALAIDFTEIARFDISATSTDLENPPPDADDIGVNTVAMAWGGNKLYLAGYNNSASFGETSIIEVTNPMATGLVTPTYSAKFSTDGFTPGGRGFSGLALSPDGSQLAAAFDDGVAGTPLGLQVFDTSNNTQTWAKANRGGSGVDFDPGFPGGNPAVGSGVAYVESFGSGRRALQDAATGADIWTPSDGMIWIPNAGVTNNFVRDIAFDPDTGDMYVRSKNDVFYAERSGDNTTNQSNNSMLLDLADGPFVNYQHIAFLDTNSDGDLLILNDRSTGGGMQDFFTVTKVIDTAGVEQTPTFNFLPNGDSSPFTPAEGAGWYDYDFDSASQTLALLDISSRFVHIFSVGGAMDDVDLDDDGDVDGADFLAIQRTNSSLIPQWQTEYGTVPQLASASVVPEPSTIGLLLVGLLSVSRNRNRSKST